MDKPTQLSDVYEKLDEIKDENDRHMRTLTKEIFWWGIILAIVIAVN